MRLVVTAGLSLALAFTAVGIEIATGMVWLPAGLAFGGGCVLVFVAARAAKAFFRDD